MTAKVVIEQGPVITLDTQQYNPEIMKIIMELLAKLPASKTDLHKRTRFTFRRLYRYCTTMQKVGLLAPGKPEVKKCPTCHASRPLPPKLHLTEKGLAYLRKLQEADEILQQ